MAKTQKDMTDAEFGAHIRAVNKKYTERWNALQRILKAKIAAAKITVSDAEVQAELKKI